MEKRWAHQIPEYHLFHIFRGNTSPTKPTKVIKFFRRIRQKLLSENKFSRYLLYALGEIILVMIGILLALQVNTWNTEKNNREKEQLYLQSFYNDIQTNLNQLDRVIAKSTETINTADSLLLFVNGDVEIKDMKKVQRLVMAASNYTIFLSQEGTINDIFGSGDLALIQNDSVRMVMVNWTASLKYLREFEDLGKKNQLNYMDYLANHVPMYKRGLGQDYIDQQTMGKLMNNERYLNLVSDQKRLARTLNRLYGNIRMGMVDLSNLVAKNLETHD